MSSINYNNNLLHEEITDDVLQTIPDEELLGLRDIYKNAWPYAAQAYTFVDQLLKWKRQKSNAGVRFTCPDGNWQRDGTFVAIVTECTYNIFFFTLDKQCRRLAQALLRTKLIDWAQGPYICAIHEDHDAEMMKTLRKVGEIDFEIESTCWWLSKEDAIKFRTTFQLSEMVISPLKPTHASVINPIWPHSFPGSDAYLANLIEKNGGLGIFTETERKLCAWIMTNDFGALSILQTLDEHKRKGFAKMLIKCLANANATLGMDSITYIVRKNTVSQAMFRALGFQPINHVRWVQFSTKSNEDYS